MDTTSTTKVTQTRSNDFVYNPKSQLTGDDFLKLFMTQLQMQDPTSPMETKDMLEQTSQLTQLKTNQDLKDTLNKLMKQMGASAQFSTVSMIGKMADTGHNGFAITDAANLKKEIPFDLYFNDKYSSATIQIMDRNNNVIRSVSLDNGGKAGIAGFTWDGRDDSGNPVKDGKYFVSADYITKNGSQTTKLGVYPINSVRFDKEGKALLNVDNQYIPLEQIKEVM